MAVGALALLALVVLAAFPWGMLRTVVEGRLSAALNRKVTIAAIDRIDGFSLHPVVRLRQVRVPQAIWAGPGDLARVDEAQIRFAALPAIFGRFEPESIDVRGLRLKLIRDKAGRESWAGDDDGEARTSRPRIGHLGISDSVVEYRDAKRDRGATVRLTADSRRGVLLAGRGRILGEPVAIIARGGAIDGLGPDARWPFRARIEGSAVGMTFAGTMDRPLDFGHFTADATAHASDLALIDAIIEAGLPATQPVRLSGNVRRDAPRWRITGFSGTIGRSDIAGHGTIDKRDGRSRVVGDLTANRFDFDDLSSDEGRRIAAAKRARYGKRIVPDTAIDLDNVARSDGELKIAVRQLLWRDPSPFRTLRGTIKVDRSRVIFDPLVVGLVHGTMAGRVIVDQRRGGPQLTIRLEAERARLSDFFPGSGIDGALRGHIRLDGPGRTIRSAVGRSSGSIALVARDGSMPARAASLLGQDIGRGVTTGEEDRAVLRCLIVRLDVAGGTARPNPILIDTSRASTRAVGTIDMASERLMLSLAGAPKKGSLLRLAGTVPVSGTIKAPVVRVPAQAKSAGGILKMLGRAIAGKQGPVAGDADCPALSAKALR